MTNVEFDKTIAAIATPVGEGGIGTVRISGNDATAIADKVFCSVSNKKLQQSEGYRAHFGQIISNGKTVDQAVALVFKAPKSYTGEDTVELSVHGGEFVVRSVLRAVLDAGAVPAGPGEFTKRAFLNGKLKLSEAEAIMDIISAKGEQALSAGVEALNGGLTQKCNKLRDDLSFAAATVAAFSDFPDEEPEFSGIDRLGKILLDTENDLKALAKTYDTGRMIRNGINTVIIGPPNAGKSTLMNLMTGCDRSIVTSVAGTTRDVVEETVTFADVTLRLSDTAGIRETEDEVEKIGVERTIERISSADLIIAVFDGTDKAFDVKKLLKTVSSHNTVAVFNKSDISAPDTSSASELNVPFVVMAANSGKGLDSLAETIKKLTGTAHLDGTAAVYLNERQRNCVLRALELVTEAINTLNSGYTPDAVGILIDDALAALLELTGERVTSRVADEVFSRFCVGK